MPGTITNHERLTCHKPPPPRPKDPQDKDKPRSKDKDKDPKTQSTKGKKPKSFRHVVPRGIPDHIAKKTEHVTMAGTDLMYLDGLPEEPAVGQEYKASFAYQSLGGEWLYADLNVQVTGFDDPANLADGQGLVYVQVRMVQYLDARVFDMDPLSNATTRLYLNEGETISVSVSSLKPT